MKHAEVADNFLRNLGRVESLITVHVNIGGADEGRATVEAADLSRAAVMFLHAALEDLMRSALLARLPEAAGQEEFYQRMPFALAERRADKISPAEMAREYRGKTVDEVLRQTVDAYLERASFSSVDQLVRGLRRMRMQTAFVGGYAAELQVMMQRRHRIVHTADREIHHVAGRYAITSLAVETVRSWKTCVEAVGNAIIAQLREDES